MRRRIDGVFCIRSSKEAAVTRGLPQRVALKLNANSENANGVGSGEGGTRYFLVQTQGRMIQTIMRAELLRCRLRPVTARSQGIPQQQRDDCK